MPPLQNHCHTQAKFQIKLLCVTRINICFWQEDKTHNFKTKHRWQHSSSSFRIFTKNQINGIAQNLTQVITWNFWYRKKLFFKKKLHLWTSCKGMMVIDLDKKVLKLAFLGLGRAQVMRSQLGLIPWT
jgi:hypothetical protein